MFLPKCRYRCSPRWITFRSAIAFFWVCSMARRAFLLIILAYGLVIAGLVTLRGELLALALPIVLYLLIGLWRAPEEIHLEIQRTIGSERAAPGDCRSW